MSTASIFQRTLYNALTLYNQFMIYYEQNILKPLQNVNKAIYKDSIIKITEYNLTRLNKRDTYYISWTEYLTHIFLYYFKSPAILDTMRKRSFHECGIPFGKVYEIQTSDNRLFLTRGSFKFENAPTSQYRHKYIHASISDAVDVTKLINKYVTSFEAEMGLDITVLEFVTLLYLKDEIDIDMFVKLISDKENLNLYVINDDTLDVRTFKDKETIVL
jgi:hypothetical protein